MKGKRYTIIVALLAAGAVLAAALGMVALRPAAALGPVPDAVWRDFSAPFARADVIAPPEPLDFSPRLMDLNDRPVAWDSLRGRVTIVNFWALWCPPCLTELPSLHALQSERADDDNFAVVYISMDFPENAAALSEVMALRKVMPIDTLYISDTESWDALGLRALPTTLVLDPQGRVAYRLAGDADWTSPAVRAFLDALLGKTDGQET